MSNRGFFDIQRSADARSWDEFVRQHQRDETVTSLTFLLDPIPVQEIQVGFRITAYLVLGPDFAALAACCRQRGFYTGLLRQERLHREIAVYGYDLAFRWQRLRQQRLAFLQSVWSIDQELASHRPFGQ